VASANAMTDLAISFIETSIDQRKYVQSFLERKPLFNIPHCASDRQHRPFTDQRRSLLKTFQICAASRELLRATTNGLQTDARA
jgi:hypothetical protein